MGHGNSVPRSEGGPLAGKVGRIAGNEEDSNLAKGFSLVLTWGYTKQAAWSGLSNVSVGGFKCIVARGVSGSGVEGGVGIVEEAGEAGAVK